MALNTILLQVNGYQIEEKFHVTKKYNRSTCDIYQFSRSEKLKLTKEQVKTP